MNDQQIADLAWFHALLGASLPSIGGSADTAPTDSPGRFVARIRDREYRFEIRPAHECPCCGDNVPEGVMHGGIAG